MSASRNTQKKENRRKGKKKKAQGVYQIEGLKYDN